jgi:uncharacterized protein (TIGR00251 family)
MALPVVSVRVRVTPRGGRDAVIGFRARDGVLVLRVAAPPVDGAANRACLALVAETLGVRRSQVRLSGGETAREKRFTIAGMTEEERDQCLRRLPAVS